MFHNDDEQDEWKIFFLILIFKVYLHTQIVIHVQMLYRLNLEMLDKDHHQWIQLQLHFWLAMKMENLYKWRNETNKKNFHENKFNRKKEKEKNFSMHKIRLNLITTMNNVDDNGDEDKRRRKKTHQYVCVYQISWIRILPFSHLLLFEWLGWLANTKKNRYLPVL